MKGIFLCFLGTEKDHFPSLISSVDSQRDSLQSLSCRRYAAQTATTTLKYTLNSPEGIYKWKTRNAEIQFLCLCFCFSIQLRKFKEDNLDVGFGSATLALEQAIEKTIANIKWVTENKAHVMKWFTEETTWIHKVKMMLLCVCCQGYVMNDNHYNHQVQRMPRSFSWWLM